MSANHQSYNGNDNNGGNGNGSSMPLSPSYPTYTRGGDKFTIEQMAWALRKNSGLVMPTARTLQCSQKTVQRYLQTYPELRIAQQESRKQITNLAEVKVVEKIRAGDNFALGMWLKTQAGWSEKNTVEHTGPEGGPIQIEADVTLRHEKEVIVGMIQGHLSEGYSLADALKNVVLLGIPKEALRLLTRADLNLTSNGNGAYHLPEESLRNGNGSNGDGAD